MKVNVKVKFLFLALLLTGCSKPSHNYKIIALLGCESIDSIQDLELSLKNNNETFQELKVKVIRDTLSADCGYLLQKEDKEHKIKSVLTDIDLMFELKAFFN
ncbi:hypothetical protein EV198_1570 [Roseivirga ehrenbergii]|uniref:Lipoprotein n=1 Tax=Roseivirga ehrenbergii (strain DSM 102268 / JCM 13514 / KCTC 12282 / NCIMB 14502 / KMM 6017) TaxID=279360 RepID=A0A150XRP9_ROSEK|nr:hypothetical protein [Roseivirga ehrenbergii]KYG81396.1 hypothetical protein MB14_12425 [Roseivirga ehrenbergii]TCL10540.1 hypothetical protein EV198_1570 [Roseivirga ehrenbergii]